MLRESTVGGMGGRWGVERGGGRREAWEVGLASLSVGPTTPKAGATKSWAEQKPATSAVLQCCVSQRRAQPQRRAAVQRRE